MEMVNLNGKMEAFTMENFNIIIYMVKEYINGLMAENTKEIGKIIKCMDTVYSHGPMKEVKNMKETTLKIKEKDMENFTGPTAEFTVVYGEMVNNMVKVNYKT
mmetsp:Transcript_19148/g.2611  ORF Transcript_19148/g.2611 Transcript_19148/m.2611 type:complete len:103 (-) Transcript_19148:233-541(-)|eukprot:CAMPEP_0204821408 /NCGR_PEP_ID=MMETSP1018-20131115/15605_1 /ASSEMBLY_ACC=CAM_ASM_000518 /TAXON_ID=46462 /ORGANISM="Anophryoides haemophila, Strain AH6" /LENGTH=102 /DNA_ID=CAMNT_0051929919 /DNA_START=690 /DNA_END=998 /DNA_ORIENTATION=+